MDAKQIIDKLLKAEHCGDIFDRNQDKVKNQYRSYVRVIHPDICNEPDANTAFQKLSALYSKAINLLKDGKWDQANTLYLEGFNGIQYLDCKGFDLGTRYITEDEVIYVFDDNKKDKYLTQFMDMVRKIRYSDNRMRDKYKYRVPYKNLGIANGKAVLFKRDPREFPMDLFLSAYGDKLDGKDIAWMISRMCDLMCFLGYNNIVLNGVIPENLFINPDQHTMHIYGGWWYAAREGSKMTGVSRDVYNMMPNSARTDGTATRITDMECIRKMFRDICKGKDIPKPVTEWLNAGSMNDPIEEYARWNEALDKAYGTRKFKVFSADADKIYTQN